MAVLRTMAASQVRKRARARDDLECEACFDGNDADGCHYAWDNEGTIWLFNNDSPMPEEGFTSISSTEAIRTLVETQQNFEEDY